MLDQIPPTYLAKLKPIDDLSEESRQELMGSASIGKLSTSDRLTYPKEENFITYLLKGELVLASQSGPVDKVAEKTERAFKPIFTQDSLAKVAVAARPSIVLRLDKVSAEKMLLEAHAGSVSVKESDGGAHEASIMAQVYEAYNQDELELPAFPDVAMKVRRLVNNEDTGINDLITVINTDATIAGKLINVANSPLYRGSRTFESVRDAVTRLGMQTTSQVVTTVALNNTFKARSSIINNRMRQLWEHSLHTSALSHAIAQNVAGIDPDRAMLAGLMHDIGVIPILHFAEKTGGDISETELEQAITGLRDMVGVMVCNTWELGDDISEVITDCDHWDRDSEQLDYCDVVQVAQLIDLMGKSAPGIPDISEVPAAGKLKLNDDASIQTLLTVNAEMISELNSAVLN